MAVLAEHIQDISGNPLQEVVEELAALTPDLTATLSVYGTRLITHPKYQGTADLDVYARLFLNTGKNIANSDSTPLQTRLEWVDLQKPFQKLYRQCKDSGARQPFGAWLRSWRDISLGCPCCSGVPYAVINSGLRDDEAFLFTEAEFRRLWPDGEDHGGMYGQDYARRYASREMVVEALARAKEE
ncbi:hypothetical protein BX600DRAFT_514271 [Xylariales sp. PMI_506]|nr:hypothetical protein BX600DRAFT_514271 [Xylariales sp. PMI_506]